MNADTLIPLIFGRLTLEALPHEPIVLATMVVVVLGGAALVGALTPVEWDETAEPLPTPVPPAEGATAAVSH